MMRAGLAGGLRASEQDLVAEARLVHEQLRRVTEALMTRDPRSAAEVVEGDDAVDRLYLVTEDRLLKLIARQGPVAGDLRLVSAILHSNLHFERIGDLCVNIAKFVLNGYRYPTDSQMLRTLMDMGDRAAAMINDGIDAFVARDLELAERLTVSDDAIDVLNRTMLIHLRPYLGDPASFEWASHLLLIARYLERIGDHMVDVGEQVSFLVTGVFREFADASHPHGAST